MKLDNPLQMNDWAINKFILVVLSVQLMLFGTVSMDIIGLNIPLLRQIIGFIYLTFLPGILILRILKLHHLGNIRTILYSIGLSLSVLFFIGFFMNMLYPLFGIFKPITLFPLFSTISGVVLILVILSYFIDRDDLNQAYFDVKTLLSTRVLFLLLLPFLSVLGTHLVNYYSNNLLLMIMLFSIFFVVLVVGIDKFIPSDLYPLTVWIIALSLILHKSLISPYINVLDVITEYRTANIVIQNSFWDYTIDGGSNSVLSCVILTPIYYYICNTDITWIYKIIFPIIYSFLAIGAYLLFYIESKSDKIAFFSSIFLISVTPFFAKIPFIPKQSIAEIFLILVFLILVDKRKSVKESLLLVIFSICLVISHYGTSYLFLFSLIFLFVYMSLFGSVNSIKSFLISNYNSKYTNLYYEKSTSFISFNFMLLYVVFAVGWYMYVSNSSIFDFAINMGNDAIHNISQDFFNPQYSRGLNRLDKFPSPLHRLGTLFYILTQFLIFIGLFETVILNKKRFDKFYTGMSVYFFLLLVLSLAKTKFSAMDPGRLFQLSLIILAPYCIIGFFSFQNFFSKKCSNYLKVSATNFKLLSIFFAIFLLFNTGVIYEITKDQPSSISISQESITKYGDIDAVASFYGSIIVTENVFSGEWLGKNMNPNKKVYRGDFVQSYPSLYLFGNLNLSNIETFSDETKSIAPGYIQLSYANIIGGIGSKWYNPLQQRAAYSFNDTLFLFNNKNKLYDNGGSYILFGS
ncbi:hypothetical protein MSSAC_4197 [Methanosarcina siciliae C2J]|uniref:DUF2206 domain-containing protein n=1 Tax=Methanosarcina siciliae C2J TaxID=1434118 RepID=A0A0E3PTH8_9EURY|nr:DUF2206 domain-containing protein [Methanosarcina siciliae]AKB38787.1 hypothetical protein MSSAC_4197 [Methanosarcina siciliae C2J]